ncbi:hypothetical protein [Piscinibacter defluvii]|uniref:hypothetical protein n=1 Tax=Piscinibacter defluvii TaxID=1796922 RepID=UPI000FDDBF4D|nr:hypothetical protein [Piscinibacter defluvii]
MGLLALLKLPPLKRPPGAQQQSSGSAPGDARLQARTEALAVLTQLSSLAHGGIADAALAAKAAKDLAALQASFDNADKLAADAAAIKAFAAVRAAAAKPLTRAQGYQQLAGWQETTWKPLAAGVATALAGIGPAAPKKAVQAEFDKLDAARKAKYGAADLAGLKALEPRTSRLAALAARLAQRSPEIDAELARLDGVVGKLAADTAGTLPARQAELAQRKANAWPDGATLDAIEASLATFDALLQAHASAVTAAKASQDARIAFESAAARAKALVDDAVRIAGRPNVLPAALAGRFAGARKAVDDAVAALDWPAALAAHPALVAAAAQVGQASAAKNAFDAALAKIQADVLKARAAVNAGTPLPGTLAKDFQDADNDVSHAQGLRDWAQAQRLLPNLATRTRALLDMQHDGRKFYEALNPYLAVRQRANVALSAGGGKVQRDNARLSMLGTTYWQADKAMTALAAAKEWGDAKKAIPAMSAAAFELVNAQASYDSARVPFDTAMAAVTNRWTADGIADAPKPAYAAPAAAYVKLRTQLNDAANAGDFASAMPLVPRLQAAIDALLAAKQADDHAKAAFDSAFNALAGYAEAKALQGNAALALAEKVHAFNLADQAMTAARDKNDWAAASAAVPAVAAAIAALKAAQTAFNGAFGAADEAALRAKIDALKPRTDRANDAPVPKFVEKEQQEVRGKLADVEARFSERDFATAQAEIGTLEQHLRGMEHAKGLYDAHKKKFDAAKSGPIAAALAKPLAPPKLDADRRRGLAASEAAIVALADAGQLSRADAAIGKWQVEAQGWGESKQAFDALTGGNPDVATLEKLAKQPGGEAVLDKLIANLDPNTTPSKVLVTAIKARYGFDLKRFTDKNKDDRDLDDLHGKNPNAPDPDVQKLYALMAKIPAKRIKGKIEQMVVYSQDESRGVYYPDKKIYLAADRPGKTGGTWDDPDEERFGVEGKVLPPGEKVAPGCEPKDPHVPVPEFDFVLMHEVGHAEDDGQKYMDSRTGADGVAGDKAYGGWATESPKTISRVAAAHFDYDQDYLCDTLEDKGNQPPRRKPKARSGVGEDEWERRRVAALTWCRMIRAKASPWSSGAVVKQIAIGTRVYQEAYNDGRWYSYELAARAQGITAYQFRAPGEWFAELYAAHFANKLKREHPAMKWLAGFKAPE